MGILDFLKGGKGVAAGAVVAPPALDAPSGAKGANMGFMTGTDGKPRLSWARYDLPTGGFGHSYGGISSGQFGNMAHRERGPAAAVSTELAVANPTVATILGTLDTHTVGTGLTLSSRPDATALGIADKAAQALSHAIETRWNAWAADALECDLAGRHTIHDLASAAFKHWLMTGEVLSTLDWYRPAGVETGTKVSLLDSRQIEARTQTGDGFNSFMGVAFNAQGRASGLWLRNAPLGALVQTATAALVPMRTRWGRPKVLHTFEMIAPGQVRGLSPIVAALTPAHERAMLQELTVAGTALHNSFAVTVESDLPSSQALNALKVDDMEGGAFDPIALRAEWYDKAKIKLGAGTISHLAPGDKLKFNKPEALQQAYDPFQKALTREASRAAGAMVEDISGDFSQTSFSASRLATELPYRLTLKRRKAIVEKFYATVFEAWLEEQIERGFIELPAGAPPFWAARKAYCCAQWLGNGRVVADAKKAADATQVELKLGLTTLRDALAERGLDLEETIRQRKAERDMLRDAGLPTIEEATASNPAQVQDAEDDQSEQPDGQEPEPTGDTSPTKGFLQ